MTDDEQDTLLSDKMMAVLHAVGSECIGLNGEECVQLVTAISVQLEATMLHEFGEYHVAEYMERVRALSRACDPLLTLRKQTVIQA